MALFLFRREQVGTKLYSPALASGDADRKTMNSSGFSGYCFIDIVTPECDGGFVESEAFPDLKDFDRMTEILTESC